MARIEWVKQRLENWALWKVRERSGGLGFASRSSFLREVDSSRYREAIVPVDEVDAALTEQAVEALKLGHGHLHKTLHCIYVDGIGIKGTARVMARAESTIKAQLDQADHLLKRWFDTRAEQQARARQQLRAVQEAARP